MLLSESTRPFALSSARETTCWTSTNCPTGWVCSTICRTTQTRAVTSAAAWSPSPRSCLGMYVFSNSMRRFSSSSRRSRRSPSRWRTMP
ncbi:hypothetical protein D3C74_376740 [compost metagenome]